MRELSERLRKRELSPVELTEAYLARADSIGAELNAYATVTRDLALAQAKKAEAEIAAGSWRGPLHGMPYAAKDLLAVRWYPTTWGAAPLAAQKLRLRRHHHHAAHRRRRRAPRQVGDDRAGRRARLSLPVGVGDGRGQESVEPGALDLRLVVGLGRHRRRRAGAVRARLRDLGLDPLPLLAVRHHRAAPDLRPRQPSWRHAAVLHARQAGAAGAQRRGLRHRARHHRRPRRRRRAARCRKASRSSPGRRRHRASRLRIGWVAQQGHGGPPAVEAACKAAVETLRKAGASVENVTIPDGPWVAATTTILWSEAGSSMRPLIQSGKVAELTDPLARIGGYLCETIPAADFVHAQRVRLVAQKKMEALFSALRRAGRPVGGRAGLAARRQPREGRRPARSARRPRQPVRPAGDQRALRLHADKLPIGIQFVGRALDDHVVVAAGMQLQSLTDWHKRRPPA